MPLINTFRPLRDEREADHTAADRVIAERGLTRGVTKDPGAKMMREHLRAETDAEKGLVLFERHRDPRDLAADEIGVVVGAHGAAKDDGGGGLRHGLPQRIVE